MSEDEFITLLYKNKFSKKQINNLIKLSEKYSTSLHDTVVELARRFLRSLLVHLFTFFLIVHSYIRFSKIHGYSLKGIIFFTGVICLMYAIFHLFAPLIQGYKARKTIKEIQRTEKH
ncbi:hypothetical protein EYY86_00165 [Hafnia paralvei]|uniref:hypothetical protein n=1 Tax=Hafnia paralvei TaxID=546367 RepID=UPI0010339A28|nr:hypothetical protein [Hafnia paralvei]TBM20445.1 hypothetical protein EYY86_00165 [Hafnia paralvei]